jgi:hypothetical protein
VAAGRAQTVRRKRKCALWEAFRAGLDQRNRGVLPGTFLTASASPLAFMPPPRRGWSGLRALSVMAVAGPRKARSPKPPKARDLRAIVT